VAGTTLVELLVVIVVLSIGILAVLQIFPSGLRILAYNRNAEIATKLAHDEAQRFVGRSDQMPEEIDPVYYVYQSGVVKTFLDPTRRPGDYSLVNTGNLDINGNVIDGGGHDLGYWPYLSGPNLFRRVIGEGGRVPAPRQVGGFYGGLMVLQFTPIVYNALDPGQFQIYGADMDRILGAPQTGDTPQSFQYYVQNIDQSTANLILPADPFAQREFRLAMAFYVTKGGVTYKKDRDDISVIVAPIAGGGFYTLPLSTGDGTNPAATSPTNPAVGWLDAGETFDGAELESVRVAREYDQLTAVDTFSDPYQYKLLDPNLGLILFSDLAYKTYELRNGRREPLEAHVNYDVYDWRIMRDEFRVPDGQVPQTKLELGNIKVKGNRDVDNTVYQGLTLQLPKGNGSTERRDMAFMDLETGGIVLEKSATRLVGGLPMQLIHVDKSVGLATFYDADGDPNNGLTGEIVYPGANTAVDIDLTGRSIRAMYQSNGEWTTQVSMAPVTFTVSQTSDLAVSQYYVGGSQTGVRNPTRIYFPLASAGQRVTIDQVWYTDLTNPVPLQSMNNQSFVVQTKPSDPTGLGYIDIQAVNPNASSFDTTTYGYAVNGVRGASITVRVLWNPTKLEFTSDSAQNLSNLEIWGRSWRNTVAETYSRRPGE
jgi:type II secretory pathway pseudopilin PulG